MKLLLRQLRRWRFRERLVRLAWGGGRWLAVVLAVLAAACLADWLYDRRAEVPLALRAAVTVLQGGLALSLAYLLVVRAWAKTPPLDELAYTAEKAIPEFDHRLVTALQLNRVGAKTHGMSAALIAEVTREAGELAARHRLTRLINYKPVGYGLAVAAPLLLAWGAFAAVNPDLATTLLKRQALMGADIPRSVQLVNETAEVWPTGSEVVLRYRVTGAWGETMAGKAMVRPEGQPADDYALAFEQPAPDGAAYFVAKLPPSSTPFTFRARLGDGRTRADGRVSFEPPPQATDVEAWQLLPVYLGRDPQGGSYSRFQQRGEVVNALPLSGIRVRATFNKPVAADKAVLVPIERGEANKEVDGKRATAIDAGADGLTAEWVFATTPRTVGYRIELTDTRGFTSPAPARRGVRMLPDEPPAVEFRRESNRNPDPTAFDGKGDPRAYEWDMPVSWQPTGGPGEGDTGPIQVIYSARSELGVGRVNLAYRVIPKGGEAENLHPRDDPAERVYKRLPLTPYTADPVKVGKWVPDLGLFEKSFVSRDAPPREYVSDYDQSRVQVELFRLPSPNPATEPGELDAGGRYNFLTGGLKKAGSQAGTFAKLEVGDTVELYVEVFDKYTVHLEGEEEKRRKDKKATPAAADPTRPAGYTREAKRKTVVTEDDALVLIRQRDEAQKRLQDKLRDIAADQSDVFRVKKK